MYCVFAYYMSNIMVYEADEGTFLEMERKIFFVDGREMTIKNITKIALTRDMVVLVDETKTTHTFMLMHVLGFVSKLPEDCEDIFILSNKSEEELEEYFCKEHEEEDNNLIIDDKD